MIKTAQRKMPRLIVQTKRHYKTKSEEETKKQCTKGNMKKMTLFVRPTKRQEEALNKARTKTKIAMFLSRKIKTKKLTKVKKQQDWIEFIDRSTKEAGEHMKKMKNVGQAR